MRSVGALEFRGVLLKDRREGPSTEDLLLSVHRFHGDEDETASGNGGRMLLLSGAVFREHNHKV